MPFVYSHYCYTSGIDLASGEEDRSDGDNDCKMPANQESPKRKQSIPKLAARVFLPGQDLEARIVCQLSNTLNEGSPASQQAAMSALDNLSSSSDNLSKMIIKSSVDRGSTSIGMSQDAALKLIQAEKLRHKRA